MSTGLVTFGETLLTFKPKPSGTKPLQGLASPACEIIQAIGGAELNVAVAHSLAGNDLRAKFVTTVPNGALGDFVVGAARDAGVDTSAIVVDPTPHAMIGTLHVVDEGMGPRPQFQRHNSSFCKTVDESTFDWASILAPPARWLHVTGITPMLSAGARASWLQAIHTAAKQGVCVGLDINWRPALGTFDELWGVIKPCVDANAITLLMLSADSLKALAQKEGVWQEPGGADSDQLYEVQRAALAALRAKWGVPLLASGFKRPNAPEAAAGGIDLSAGGAKKNKDTLMGGAGLVRWSVLATAAGEVSTKVTPTIHKPLEALGGGDAWMGAFTLSVLEAGLDQTALLAVGGGGSSASPAELDALRAACRRGDLAAAMSMAKYGDLTDVRGSELRAAESKYAGRTAVLDGLEGDVSDGLEGGSSAADAMYAKMRSCTLVPVVAIDDPEDAEPVARALLAGGIDVMELVLRTPSAEESLRRIAANVDGMTIGAGTVLSVPQADRAVAAGAEFIVSPGTNPKVVNWCTGRGVPIVPGVATATEVEAAMDLGLTHLKFFPAEANGGVKTLKSLSGPYGPSGVQFMPTGGLTTGNLADYLQLESVFCAGGTWIVPPKALKEKDYASVQALAKAAVEAAAAARK